MSSPAVFLDKDGTLIENVPYNVDPALIRLADGALQSLGLLQQAGYQVIVVSNQSGVARGYFGERDLIPVESRLRQQLAEGSVALSGFYYCPHHPEGALQLYSRECVCRKPKPGMLFEAARHHRINLSTSWLIGDILDDIESGNRAGCRTILLDNDHETEWRITPVRRPDFIVQNLLAAADVILLTEKSALANAQPPSSVASHPSAAQPPGTAASHPYGTLADGEHER
jgi:histidinol-phosphate phosphatase family protein